MHTTQQAAATTQSTPTTPSTPALRQWVRTQAEAGFGADALLQSMRASGWGEAQARQALMQTLGELAELPETGSDAKAQPEPASAVPGPALDDAPLYIDIDGHRVHLLQTLAKPYIVVFGNLFSDDECAALIALAHPRLARSLTVATDSDGEEVNTARTSDGMFFQRGEQPLIAQLEARIAALLRWPLENGEGLQILRYQAGTEYLPHYDYFDPAAPGSPSILQRGGQRIATLVIYLGEPEKGGATVFPDLQLAVAPKRGNAVFFSYPQAHPSSQTLHGGAPVMAGEKWIATKWLREKEFQ